MNLDQFQSEHAEWAEHNFPGTPAHCPLLGVAEETGELCHAHLKLEQNIRGTEEEHIAEGKDAVGDIMVYLVHYCTLKGWNLQEILDETWAHVKKRDWQKNSKDGGGEG